MNWGAVIKETGQYAYEAYCDCLIELGVWASVMVRPWHKLPDNMQAAWRQAAHAALQHGWSEAMH